MKVITLSEVASRIRCRRSGKTFLTQFINECTIEDAIPLDRIKQAREEIENEVKFWSESPKTKLLPSVKAVRDGKVNSYKHCLEILDNLIAESEGVNEPIRALHR